MPPNLTPRRPGLQTRERNVPHPSMGLGNPYSPDLRTLVMAINQLGPHPPAVHNLIQQLRLNHVYPSMSTQRRWERLNEGLGHYLACRKTGNRFASRLRGPDLIYLSMYRVAYPKASHAEINAFLYYVNFGDPTFRFYSHSQISKAEKLIGLSSKRGSTTAYRAFLAVNLQKRWVFWNLPYPMGIAGIRRRFIIDLDECGIFVDIVNRSRGKAFVGVRVRDFGPYEKSDKLNFICAVCGEDGNAQNQSRRWADSWLAGGTTNDRMVDFVQMILDDIGPANGNNFYVFTMDNLNSHKCAAVQNLIHLYGHGVVYRAPYWAVDGPIEYVFNTLQSMLKSRLHQIRNMDDLQQAVYQSIQSMDNFGPYFVNCGFNIN